MLGASWTSAALQMPTVTSLHQSFRMLLWNRKSDDSQLSSATVDAPSTNGMTLYDLIANVTYESVAGTTRDKENTIWKADLRAAGGSGDNDSGLDC